MRVLPRRCVGLLLGCLLLFTARAQADPEQTVRSADDILHEIMVIPARQIPESLMAEAQGVAIIPDVIKIGFVAGIRRGHGVVMVRDAEGQWCLPQFVTLTGGSVGWQAGVQGTDVVLVFLTKKSVEGLMRGKFTIGADASVAAGPVGRNAAAATDVRLKAEILSYSRSRGLFVGLALDGSSIDVDADGQATYYGAPPGQVPRHIPQSAVKLVQDLVQLTPPAIGGNATVAPPAGEARLSTLRESLNKNARQLYAILDEPWRKFLALPREVFEGTAAPQLEPVQTALRQYDRVSGDPKYATLAARPEFQATYEVLRELIAVLSDSARHPLPLPPPPMRRIPAALGPGPQGRRPSRQSCDSV